MMEEKKKRGRPRTQKYWQEEEIQQSIIDFFTYRDERSFTKMYKYLYPLFKGSLYKQFTFSDHDMVNDILSETFISIYNKIGKLDPLEYPNVYNYLYTILTNTALQYIRTAKIVKFRNKEAYESYHDDLMQISYCDEEENIIKYDIILDIINNLEWEFRDFVIDKYVNHMKNPELVIKYEWPLSMVKNRAWQAINRIRQQYRIQVKGSKEKPIVSKPKSYRKTIENAIEHVRDCRKNGFEKVTKIKNKNGK